MFNNKWKSYKSLCPDRYDKYLQGKGVSSVNSCRIISAYMPAAYVHMYVWFVSSDVGTIDNMLTPLCTSQMDKRCLAITGAIH